LNILDTPLRKIKFQKELKDQESKYLLTSLSISKISSIFEAFKLLNLFIASKLIFEISKKPIFPLKNFETATSFAAFKTTPKSRLFRISSFKDQIGYLLSSIFLNSKDDISSRSIGFRISQSTVIKHKNYSL
jgi:hypothetical protein